MLSDDEDLAAEAAAPADNFEDKAPVKASMDDEWPEEDVKPKGKKGKGKKGGKQQAADLDEDDFLEQAAREAAAAKEAAAPVAAEPAPEADVASEAEEPAGGQLLSKKEKERLKKEKEKVRVLSVAGWRGMPGLYGWTVISKCLMSFPCGRR